MTQTRKNILIGLGVVLLVGSGFGAGWATADECPTEHTVTVSVPELNSVCDVKVDPCVCECRCEVEPVYAEPRCPEVKIVPASSGMTDYRPWTATLLAGDRAAVGSLTWNRWERLRPSVGVLWTDGRHEALETCWGYYGQPETAIRTDDSLTALAGVSISF